MDRGRSQLKLFHELSITNRIELIQVRFSFSVVEAGAFGSSLCLQVGPDRRSGARASASHRARLLRHGGGRPLARAESMVMGVLNACRQVPERSARRRSGREKCLEEARDWECGRGGLCRGSGLTFVSGGIRSPEGQAGEQ